ncbi:MAG: DMT family protein [Bacteroidota bacterium]
MVSDTYGPFQLKIIQEVIPPAVFVAFSTFFLRQEIKWNYAISFLFILGTVFFAFRD